jgi:hypothetical protein
MGAPRPLVPVSALCGMVTAVNTVLTDVWRQLLADPAKSWALFEHGTCVVPTAPDGEPAEQATELHVVHVEDNRGAADPA